MLFVGNTARGDSEDLVEGRRVLLRHAQKEGVFALVHLRGLGRARGSPRLTARLTMTFSVHNGRGDVQNGLFLLKLGSLMCFSLFFHVFSCHVFFFFFLSCFLFLFIFMFFVLFIFF